MPEEQQPKPEAGGHPQARSPGGRRRGRRGGRGRRRPAPASPVSGPPPSAESPAEHVEPPIRLREEMPVRPAPSKPHKVPPPVSAEAPVVHAAKPHGSAIGQVVQEVREIVESLEQALEEMEEVLRLVELAEQQKTADERELEALRRALHKLRPPHRERREDEH